VFEHMFDYARPMKNIHGQRQDGATGTVELADRDVIERLYLRTYEVAEILHVSPKTVTRWAKDGKLPFSRTLGGHRRYPEAEIRALAADLRVLPDHHLV
jgi:excisionase family DNA binding protein